MVTTYTDREVIEKLLDVIKRADETWCELNDVPRTTDDEWDMAIQIGEDHLEELDDA